MTMIHKIPSDWTHTSERKKRREMSIFFLLSRFNPFTHWLRFQFLLGFIHPFRSIICFCLHALSTRRTETERLSFAHTPPEQQHWKANHFVRKSIKSKMEWLMADMGILLILWKCGLYLHLRLHAPRIIMILWSWQKTTRTESTEIFKQTYFHLFNFIICTVRFLSRCYYRYDFRIRFISTSFETLFTLLCRCNEIIFNRANR